MRTLTTNKQPMASDAQLPAHEYKPSKLGPLTWVLVYDQSSSVGLSSSSYSFINIKAEKTQLY